MDVPTDENEVPKIILRADVDEDGFLYLYDAVSGREVACLKGVSVTVSDYVDDVQQAEVRLDIDPRLFSDEALQQAREEGLGWEMTEYIHTKTQAKADNES